MRRKRSPIKKLAIFIGAAFGGIIFFALWLVAIISGLAVPACAVWALGHFAFGWW